MAMALAPDGYPRPSILIQPGQIDTLASQGESALVAASLPIYQRGEKLVCPVTMEVPATRGRMTTSAGFKLITPANLIDFLSRAADWRRGEGSKATRRDPPKAIAEVILSRLGEWSFPSVAGVITTPTIRPDGSLLITPGYDPTTRLYHFHNSRLCIPIIQDPTQQDALEALELLEELLTEFPFVGAVDRSVALSAIITPIVRGAMTVAPMHAIKASTSGTGKSYLADIISAIHAGRPCPVITLANTVKENESRIGGLLIAGFPLVSLDNINGELGGDLLCQAVERPIVQVRKLQASDIFEIESRATFLATGNNVRIRGDMTRRTVLCQLDAGMERPEQRRFLSRPVEEVLANRGPFVAACLTICRAYLAHGSGVDLVPLPSFEEWSGLVRSALVWLGLHDPVESTEAVREDDPEISELKDITVLWHERFGSQQMTVRRLAEQLETEPEFADLRDAVARCCGYRGTIDKRAFGKWLHRNCNRIAGGLKIIHGARDTHAKTETWRIVPAG